MNWIEEFFAGRLNKPDILVAELSNVIKKEIGKNAPNIIFEDLENKRTSIENLKGDTIILNFWSLSCGSCRILMPELSKLQKEYYDNV